MGKNQSASGLINVINYDNFGNISFVSGSTTLMQVSSSGAITTTGTISGGAAADALLLNGTGSLAFVTTASYNVASASFSSRTTQVERTYATTGSNTFTGPQFASNTSNAISFTSTASLYSDGGLRVQGNSFVSGTAYFNNIVVYGTSSIQYITSSQVNVGTNIITVNTDTPAVRFGGLAVFDSGSTQLTGSILWDSEKNHWVYSNPSGSSYSGGMLISGPRSSALGSEQGTTACMLLVGQGSDHLTSSMIYHDSTRTCFNGNTILACSNNIGSDLNSRQTFTGSVVMTGSLLVNGLGTFSYNDNSYQGLTIRNINVGNAALAGLAIQNSSGTIVAQMNYVSTVYANTTLRDTFLFNTVAAQKLAFGTNSGGGGTRADIYFSVNPAFTLDSNNPNQIHIVGCTKNVIINYSGTDCGQKFQVNGTALITGATSFSTCVGIGTSSPRTRLQVTPGYNAEVPVLGCASGIATFTSTNTNYGLQFNSTSDGSFHIQSQRFDNVATAYNLILNFAGGNVGIGTNSVDRRLTINSGASEGILGLTSNNGVEIDMVGYGTGFTYPQARIKLTDDGFYGGSLSIWTKPNGAQTNALAERVRITGCGKLLVGTSTAGYGLFGEQRMTINPTNDGITVAPLRQNFSAYTIQSDNNTGNRYAVYIANASSAEVGSMSFTSTSVSYNTTSDYRLKQDFKDFKGLDLISKIKTYDFEWKINCNRSYGVIAHELQEVIPYIVMNEKDGEKLQSVDYSKLVPILIKSIQEQQCKIVLLESCLGIS